MVLKTREVPKPPNKTAYLTTSVGCLLLTALFSFCCQSAFAQLNLRRGDADRQTVFAIAPREATRPLKIAEKAIEDRDYVQATRLLGDLLADPMLNEFLVPDAKIWGRAVSLRNRAEQLMGQIPWKQRTAYEEKYGVRARVLLDKGVAENNMADIAAASRLYFHTEAGLEATMLVGHSNLSLGRPVMAAQAFEKVASHPLGRERFDPEATLLAAVSWSLSGSPDKAERLLADLRRRLKDVEVRFYGKTLRLADDGTPLQEWIANAVESTPLQSHPVVNQWLVHRGNASRNAESGSGFPLLSPRWSLRTVVDPSDEEEITAYNQKLISSKNSPMPKVHPVAIGDTLVIRTEDRMFGVDANNGKRIWSFPPTNVFRKGDLPSDGSWQPQYPKLHRGKLRERLWFDSLFGQISSNGDSVFSIPNPGISTDRDDWRSYDTQAYDEPTDLRRFNELKSLDLKQQGALQWQVGGESGLDEPKLARAFFLGAPLPIGDRLYAICFQDQSVRLVVLEAETGRLAWARHLASTEEAVLFQEDRKRRLAGATPSEANGMLICPTGLNAIVAVDLATKSMAWGFQYSEPKRTRVAELTEQMNNLQKMWRDTSVTLAGGTVIYTPVNSNDIFCLDLQTGQDLWGDRDEQSSRASKKDAMHVETVRNGKIVLTYRNRLHGIDLKTGQTSWKTELGDFGLVSGRGYVSGEHCYIPVTNKKVLKLNIPTGQIVESAATEKVLGNLISYRGDVISHGADHLTAYPRDEPSRLLLEQTPEAKLDSHALLAIKAQLHLRDKEYSQAVDAISKAYDLFPNSNYGKLLVEALTRLIDVDFAKAEQVSNRYEEVFSQRDLQQRLLRGKVEGLIKLGRLEDAFKTLIQIAETVDLAPTLGNEAGEIIDDDEAVSLPAFQVDKTEPIASASSTSEITMQFRQWLRWKLVDVYQGCDAEVQESFQAITEEHFKKYSNQALEMRHRRMRMFPSAAVTEKARLELAAELYAEELYTQAAGILGSEFNTAKDRDDAGIADLKEPIALRRAKRLLDEMVSLDLDSDRIAELENVIANMERGSETKLDLLNPKYYALPTDPSKDTNRLRTEKPDVQWHRDIVAMDQENNEDHFIGTQHFCDVISSDQPELKTLTLTYRDEFRELRLHDRLGRHVRRIYLDPAGKFEGTKQGTKGRIFLHQSLLLLCIDNEMFAIDWERFLSGESALLWSVGDVESSSAGIANHSLDGVCVLKEGTLVCMDPFTGEVLWQRTQVAQRSVLLEDADSLTIWSRSKRIYDTIDRDSGRLMVNDRIPRDGGAASLFSEDLQLFQVPRRVEKQAIVDEAEEEEGEEPEEVEVVRRRFYDKVDLKAV